MTSAALGVQPAHNVALTLSYTQTRQHFPRIDSMPGHVSADNLSFSRTVCRFWSQRCFWYSYAAAANFRYYNSRSSS